MRTARCDAAQQRRVRRALGDRKGRPAGGHGPQGWRALPSVTPAERTAGGGAAAAYHGDNAPEAALSHSRGSCNGSKTKIQVFLPNYCV